MIEDRRVRFKAPFTPGSPVIFNLDLGSKVQDACISIIGKLVTSGGASNGAVLGEGGPVNLIKHITVTANRAAGSKYPGGKIVDCSPRSLLRYATKQRNGRYYAELNNSTIGNGAAGTYNNLYLPIPIYWADPTSRNPLASALNLDDGVYKSVQVQIDLAQDLSGCFLGNDRVIDPTSALIVQWEDVRFNQTGDTLPIIQEEHEMLIAATFPQAQDFALPSDGNFTEMLILGELGPNQTLSDALLNELKISGPTVALDLYGNDIRRRMYDDGWYSVAQSATGQYFIDFTNGSYANSNPAAGLKVQWDVNSVTGPNADQFRIYTRRWLPLLQ